MLTDSMFVRSTTMEYNCSTSKATFGYATDAWHDDNMLSSNAGWYDRNREIFLFRLDVHGMSDTQEGWADSLFYYRSTGDIELLGNAQVTDTTRDMSAVAGRMLYTDSLSRLVMTREPAVIGVVKSETAPPDSVYFGADSIVAQSLMMFQIEDAVKSAAKSRLEDLSVDAVQNYRQKAAKEAAEAAAKAAENDPNRPKGGKKGGADKVEGDVKAPKVGAVDKGIDPNAAVVGLDSKPAGTDSLTTGSDSLAVGSDSLASATDSLAVQTDSIPEPLDSTKISFITAVKNVKLYKSDIQIACDSLAYNDLDSLVRMYERPIVWNESNRQYSADSLFAVLKNQSLQKASLMSNAFIAIKEDTLCYDQIRATEMLAYFDTTGALSRFDAMGDANAIFYLQEDSVYATVNKSEAKMLSACFKNGDIDRVYYFESAKNDGYPVAQMTSEERVLKGFSWQPELRPSGRQDVTPYSIRPSERSRYAARPRASFEYTDKFYPGYMPGVMKEIERGRLAKADAKARKKEAARVMPADTASVQSPDSLANVPPKDSLNAAVPAVADSTKAATDSLSMSSDSSSVNAAVLDAAALKKAQRDSLRAAKDAAREAKWARLDSLDAAKAKLAADKKAAKLRAKKLKQLKAIKAREAKENARLEKYKAVFAKKKEKEDRKAAERAAREAVKAAREAEKSAENAVDVPVEEEKS